MEKKSSIDKEVIDSIRTTLDSASGGNAVLPEKKATSLYTTVRWGLAIFIMVASLFVYWSFQPPKATEPQVKLYSVENLISSEPQAWQEDPELLDDIEFYAWMVFDEHINREGAK